MFYKAPIKANWADIDEIARKINNYGKKGSLKEEIFNGQELNRDSLLIKPIANHCYVMLYRHQERKAYIADGGNISAVCPIVNKMMKLELPGVTLINKLYIGQRETNQCASSAILIGIEFQKAHDKGEEPDNIMYPDHSTQKRLEKILHKQARD